ncbi:hypothetical protein GDO81_014683 [Engystomops pustulosus]|uniref:Uncharacterized protein n=1 Tax=Engystomops pustulosus TaxID=76066 RepID=A0AAV7BCC4_ENGPU|nr:hypothetical protein GDO81_014683 [Engystomops pustulosus]
MFHSYPGKYFPPVSMTTVCLNSLLKEMKPWSLEKKGSISSMGGLGLVILSVCPLDGHIEKPCHSPNWINQRWCLLSMWLAVFLASSTHCYMDNKDQR